MKVTKTAQRSQKPTWPRLGQYTKEEQGEETIEYFIQFKEETDWHSLEEKCVLPYSYGHITPLKSGEQITLTQE